MKRGPRQGKLLYGVAINDYDGSLKSSEFIYSVYSTWHDMIRRCYEGKLIAYQDVCVCDEWLTFSNFKEWCVKFWKPDCFLDKDLVGEGKTYGPNACAYVPRYLNNLFILRNKTKNTGMIGTMFRVKTGD